MDRVWRPGHRVQRRLFRSEHSRQHPA